MTVQNKVEPAARALLAERAAGFVPVSATALGLALWHYRGGTWELAAQYGFVPEG